MADYEWGQPEQPTARRSGIPWLWLLLGFVALMMFLNSRAQPPRPQQPGRPPARGPVEPTQAQRPVPSRPDGVQRDGDWSLEEMPGRATTQVPASTTAQTSEADPAPPKKTIEGDWQLEEVSADGNVPRGTQPATEKPADPAAPASKSTKGDWTIEEVKPEQAPDQKNE